MQSTELNLAMGMVIKNPETIDIDWNTIPESKFERFIIPPDMKNKKLFDIAQYLSRNLNGTHLLPGVEYYEYLTNHPDKVPQFIKDNPGGNYLLFGTVFTDLKEKWSNLFFSYDIISRPNPGIYNIGRSVADFDYVVLLRK